MRSPCPGITSQGQVRSTGLFEHSHPEGRYKLYFADVYTEYSTIIKSCLHVPSRKRRAMVLNCIFSPSSRESLSLHQSLEIASAYLDIASKKNDPKVVLVLCQDTKASLAQARKAAKRSKDQSLRNDIGSAYTELARLLESKGYHGKAKFSHKKAKKWR